MLFGVRTEAPTRGHGRRVRQVMARAAVLTVVAGLGTGAAAGAATLDGASAIHVVSKTVLDPRLTQYTLSTPALAKTTPLRILLPTGYAAHPDEHYPVIYLLHGCCNYDVSGAASWTVHGDAEGLTAGLPVIVVMPDDGQGGMYTNWYNNGKFGPPDWETYDIDELIPWVQANFRTIPNRGHRAIAGLSMGGFGAMSLAARHPDLFSFAASFSGVVDNHDTLGNFQLIDDALAVQDGGNTGSVWGPYETDAIRWWGDNPVDLAENLRGLGLQIRTGNGDAGGPFGGGPDAIEMNAYAESLQLNDTFNQLGIAHVWDDYGPGAHQWPYWTRDFKETLPAIMADFTHPPAPPKQITYTSIQPSYEAYGWNVTMHRSVLEFSTLENADRSGFTLAGSGSGTVSTPRILKAGRAAIVTTTTAAQAVHTERVTANAQGELTIDVPLGPSNAEQEAVPGAVTNVDETQVTIDPLALTGTHRTMHHTKHRANTKTHR